MKFFPRLLLRSQFEIVEIGDEVTAVSVGDNSPYSGVIVLKNESTRFMFEKLQKGITLPELIKACMDKYTDSPVEEVGPKVISFLDQLKEKNLLMEEPRRSVRQYIGSLR